MALLKHFNQHNYDTALSASKESISPRLVELERRVKFNEAKASGRRSSPVPARTVVGRRNSVSA